MLVNSADKSQSSMSPFAATGLGAGIGYYNSNIVSKGNRSLEWCLEDSQAGMYR